MQYSNGEQMGAFAKPVCVCCNPLMAKLLAIREGLTLYKHMGFVAGILNSDCQLAIQFISNNSII